MGDNTATDSDSADGVPLLEIADGSQGQNSESLDEDKVAQTIYRIAGKIGGELRVGAIKIARLGLGTNISVPPNCPPIR